MHHSLDSNTAEAFVDEEEVIFSVSDLTLLSKSLLEDNFPSVWLEGEVSNFVCPRSGHWYLSLRDNMAQVRCAMFKGANARVDFSPEDGQQVLVQAKVSLYPPRGDFQLILSQMHLAGRGALRQAFEKLKQKCQAEGLFDEKHKQALPTYPKIIGVITSPTGAAIRDICHVLKRRYPVAKVIIYPTLVQGASAAQAITKAIQTANTRDECDVLLISRGGGSLEDLWPFNEETVVRAIFASHIPTISGVGHEIDFTLADFVADLRAPTPSAAAECAVPDSEELISVLAGMAKEMQYLVNASLYEKAQQLIGLRRLLVHPREQLKATELTLSHLYQRLDKALQSRLQQGTHTCALLKARLQSHNPVSRVSDAERSLERSVNHLTHAVQRQVERKQSQLQVLLGKLDSLSPLSVLARGYSLTKAHNQTTVITSYQQVKPGDKLDVQLAKGWFTCSVDTSNSE